MLRSLRLLSLLGLTLSAGAAAHAVTIDAFTFSVPGVPGTGTASIASTPTPSSFVLNNSFTLSSVTASYAGLSFSGPVTFLSAGGASAAGYTFTGPSLFSGPTSSPTFVPGNYTLSGIADLGNGPAPTTVSLSITQPTSAPAVPEPGTLALVGTAGLGLVQIARRRTGC